jgi:hypothetical protein
LIRLVVDDENGIVFVAVGAFCPMHQSFTSNCCRVLTG